MRAVVDTSSLISLARAGLLELLDAAGLEMLVLDVVHREAVRDGLASGHGDAAAIETYLADLECQPTAAATADAAVLAAAQTTGLLVCNDLALGRRARNTGSRWLRTADLVLLARQAGQISGTHARASIEALRVAGRITGMLADAYLEELQ